MVRIFSLLHDGISFLWRIILQQLIKRRALFHGAKLSNFKNRKNVRNYITRNAVLKQNLYMICSMIKLYVVDYIYHWSSWKKLYNICMDMCPMRVRSTRYLFINYTASLSQTCDDINFSLTCFVVKNIIYEKNILLNLNTAWLDILHRIEKISRGLHRLSEDHSYYLTMLINRNCTKFLLNYLRPKRHNL